METLEQSVNLSIFHTLLYRFVVHYEQAIVCWESQSTFKGVNN